MAELVLGSVQLGLDYGIANKAGKPSRADALALVRRAADSGVVQFDTARAYGDSEDRLGEALEGRDVVLITKLSPLADLPAHAGRAEVLAAVDASVAASLAALRRKRLDCLLLHRASHMTDHGGAIWQRLVEHLAEGRVERLGVSVQSPGEALAALADPHVRHIQMPFNILDWRWAEVIAARRRRRDVTMHARSIFLQGLLLAADPAIWPPIEGVDPASVMALIARLNDELGREGAADLCLAFARGQDFLDGIVVGVDTMEQLETDLDLAVKRPLSQNELKLVASRVPRLPAALLDPAQWPKP